MDKVSSVFYLGKDKGFLSLDDASIAFAYFKSYKQCLITGDISTCSIDRFLDKLGDFSLNQSFSEPIVIHLFYEFGYINTTGSLDHIGDDEILAIEINYKSVSNYHLDSSDTKKYDFIKQKSPTFSEYSKSFFAGYRELLEGNCYQFNLTYPYIFKTSKAIKKDQIISSFCRDLKSVSAYFHCTDISILDKLILSNSPECLFQVSRKKDRYKVWSMPIKGSAKIDSTLNDIESSWSDLIDCKKNEGELYMITDLLRNDLSSIDRPTSKVVSKKLPLLVPGIMHQYSLVEVDIDKSISLGGILKSMFPGGSITGAPKKSVMSILKEIENKSRGIYCGSTVLLYKTIMAASINIRTAFIDTKEMTLEYHAGGGITLLSDAESEFEEMNFKVDSFINVLN